MVQKAPVDWEKQISKNWWKLELAPEEFSTKPGVVMSAIKQDGLALRLASSELRSDWLFVAEAVCRDGEALKFASEDMKNDARMVYWSLGLPLPPPETLTDKELLPEEIQKALEQSAPFDDMVKARGLHLAALRHASEEIRGENAALMLTVLKVGWFSAEYVESPLKEDRTFWLKVLKQDEVSGWMAFCNYAPPMLRDDKALFELALAADPLALRFAGPRLRRDRSFIVQAIRTNWRSIQAAPEEVRSDAEVLLIAAKQDLQALDFASGAFGELIALAANPQRAERERREAALRATELARDAANHKKDPQGDAYDEKEPDEEDDDVEEEEEEKEGATHSSAVNTRTYQAQRSVEEEFRELLLSLTKTNARALSLVNAADREFTLQALKQNGSALIYAPQGCHTDRDLVHVAMRTQIGTCSGLRWRQSEFDPSGS